MEDKHYNIRMRLLRDHSANEVGTWRILGEDPNCDLGGSHHEPELETVTGTYSNVVEYALNLGGFSSWGGGGRIVKVSSTTKNIDEIVRNPRIKTLREERSRLENRLLDIKRELKSFGVDE